jgi:hypothetical protein
VGTEGVFLGRNWDKNLETFASFDSKSSPPADFLGLKISTATAESGWGLGFLYIISFFTFGSSIVLSPFTLY